MEAKELKKKYLDFFRKKKHAIVDSAPLIPEHDPTVLFTTAGMHPLIPFIVGQPHPLGKRLANVQKCLRTGDIEKVGNTTHHTFFEMLGNWSFGDYYKEESIEMSLEFLLKVLKIPLDRIAVSCFKGDKNAPRDRESAKIWVSLGIPEKRIVFLGKEDNWWGPAGKEGPCGPDTEMFCWAGKGKPPKRFDPNDKKWVEVWNNVFIAYDKVESGYRPLKQKTVDTGLGVERLTAVLQGLDDNYMTELFLPIIRKAEKLSGKKYQENKKPMRIIADHIRAAVFVLGDERGAVPSNIDQGYVLRRLVRRAIRHARALGIDISKRDVVVLLAEVVVSMYGREYPLLEKKRGFILSELEKEEKKFKKTLEKGLNEFEKLASQGRLSGRDAFLLFQSFGFPLEMTEELAKERGVSVDAAGFRKEYEKHQKLSRTGAEKRFKGGLSEASRETARLHTATHLLNEALRKVLGPGIKQRGSNITPERLRFDFSFDRKLTREELRKVEKEVNKIIKKGLAVSKKEMPLKKALEMGAHGEFGARYPERVFVYSIGNCSREICMGPHVRNTSELGKFKIKKEESVAAGVRRIKAVLL